MKHIYLISTFIFTALAFSMQAQTNTKIQTWVSAHSSFGFLDIDPFKLGQGGGFALMLDKPINAKSSTRIHIGYNRMGNYNRAYGEYTYDVLPNGFQHVNRVVKLQALSFFEAGLHFTHQPNLKSPWSWSIGVNASLLLNSAGQEFNQHSISVRTIDISEENHSTNISSSASTSTSSLNEEYFAKYDISAEASLHYKIARGCNIKANL